jgi:hypothetical protein
LDSRVGKFSLVVGNSTKFASVGTFSVRIDIHRFSDCIELGIGCRCRVCSEMGAKYLLLGWVRGATPMAYRLANGVGNTNQANGTVQESDPV